MFTNYRKIVYEKLSFTEYKTASQIRDEIDKQWVAEKRTTWWWTQKEPSLRAISLALEALKKRGLAEETWERPSRQVVPHFKWRKKATGKPVGKRRSLFTADIPIMRPA